MEYTASGPFTKMVSPTPSDTVDLQQPGRGILVTSIAGGANLSFEAQVIDGTSITIAMVGVTVGTVIPCVVTRINTTSTDATVFVGY